MVLAISEVTNDLDRPSESIIETCADDFRTGAAAPVNSRLKVWMPPSRYLEAPIDHSGWIGLRHTNPGGNELGQTLGRGNGSWRSTPSATKRSY